MKKESENLIMKIVRIKINLFFIIIFTGGMMYSANRLGEAILLREIFFWASLLLIIAFELFNPLKKILDTIEGWINKNKDAKRRKNDVE